MEFYCGSCSMAGFDISGFESSRSATRKKVIRGVNEN
jgi:hypothetical protein